MKIGDLTKLLQRHVRLLAFVLIAAIVIGVAGEVVMLSVGETILIFMLASAFRLAAPLILAALGESYVERAGMFNLGIEGIMVISAFAAFTSYYFTGVWGMGLLGGALIGVVASLFFGVMIITLNLNPAISGIAILILGQALGGYFYRAVYGVFLQPPTVPPLTGISIPGLSAVPVVGGIMFNQNFFVYLTYILCPLLAIVLSMTTFGLKIRAVGEHDMAAESLGVRVNRWKYITMIVAGILYGLAGASIALNVGYFREYMVGGRGFVALSLVIFCNRNPGLVFFGGLLFGLLDALQMWLKLLFPAIPNQFVQMLPYIMTLVVLVVALKIAQRRGYITI